MHHEPWTFSILRLESTTASNYVHHAHTRNEPATDKACRMFSFYKGPPTWRGLARGGKVYWAEVGSLRRPSSRVSNILTQRKGFDEQVRYVARLPHCAIHSDSSGSELQNELRFKNKFKITCGNFNDCLGNQPRPRSRDCRQAQFDSDESFRDQQRLFQNHSNAACLQKNASRDRPKAPRTSQQSATHCSFFRVYFFGLPQPQCGKMS